MYAAMPKPSKLHPHAMRCCSRAHAGADGCRWSRLHDKKLVDEIFCGVPAGVVVGAILREVQFHIHLTVLAHGIGHEMNEVAVELEVSAVRKRLRDALAFVFKG